MGDGMKKVILGGVLGGLVVFIWGMISWMVLPWHRGNFEQFQNGSAVQAVLVASAPKAGIYLLPGMHEKGESISSDQEKALMKQAHEQMEKGPFAFVAMRPNGVGPMGMLMIRSLIIQIVGAFLLTWLLLMAKIESYLERIGFFSILAVTAGVICFLPEWNWWGFPARYTLVGIADLVIGWSLAGIVIARLTSKG